MIWFQIRLDGVANFIDSTGMSLVDKIEPKLKTEDNSAMESSNGVMSTRFDFLPPNTNFTVSIFFSILIFKSVFDIKLILFFDFDI
jgi:hypothetical protein